MCLPVDSTIEREWTYKGLLCAVTKFHPAAHRCGYVRIPPTHPLHGKYGDALDGLQVHGGINFCEPEPCTHDDGQGWWFGFDMGHCYDLPVDPTVPIADLPRDLQFRREMQDQLGSTLRATYRSLDYVVAECESLADQLLERA